MLLPRRSFILATARRFGSRSSPPVARTQLSRQIGRRAYATAGHAHAPKKAGSDLPWSHDEHSHDGHGHEDEHAEKAHEEAPAEEEQGEHKDDEAEEQYSDTQGAAEPSDQSNEGTAQSDESREQPSEESESSKESDNPPKEKSDISESQDISLLSRLKDGEVDEETKEDRVHASDLPVGKGPRRDSPPSDTREHIPDAKGAAKRRIDSEYGHRQGSEQSEASSASRTTEDEPLTSKPAGSQHTMSGKQEGVSNTDTKFSVDLMKDHPTPHKGEGVPDTAKVKGTVDPSRPQPEQRSRDDTNKAD